MEETMSKRQTLRKKATRAEEWIAECETLVSRRAHRLAFRRRGTGPTVFSCMDFQLGPTITGLSPSTSRVTMKP
jgi:hypothetical protein